jgi:hypothetical protein
LLQNVSNFTSGFILLPAQWTISPIDPDHTSEDYKLAVNIGSSKTWLELAATGRAWTCAPGFSRFYITGTSTTVDDQAADLASAHRGELGGDTSICQFIANAACGSSSEKQR